MAVMIVTKSEYGQPVKARAAGQQGVAGEDVLPAAE